MEAYKIGFDKGRFEKDHFVFKRGTGEKYFDGWDDVRYHFGLTPYSCNERELELGKMSKRLYDCFSGVYGEAGMAKYFPKDKKHEKPKSMLHFGVSSAMAALVDGKKSDTLAGGVMTEAEIDALAAIM